MTTPTGAIEFRASITSMTVSRNAAGMLTTAVNVEGEAGAYGPFAGTMVVAGANKGGAWHYDGFGMPADGSNLSGTWNGSYEFVGPGPMAHQRRGHVPHRHRDARELHTGRGQSRKKGMARPDRGAVTRAPRVCLRYRGRGTEARTTPAYGVAHAAAGHR
jgi:hypothetical protein